jgi:DNA excision repair protein ERCC-6
MSQEAVLSKTEEEMVLEEELDADEDVKSLYQGSESDNEDSNYRNMDDGDESFYQNRLLKWAVKRKARRIEHLKNKQMEVSVQDEEEIDPEIESKQPLLISADGEFTKGYKIPADIYSHLFEYQKTCTKWLWELHNQQVGGIIGDEMGLGKTIQMIAFLAGLGYSSLLNGPILIVCPATVLKQWVQEFHKWWAPFRVAILHSTGSGIGTSTYDSYESDEYDFDSEDSSKPSKPRKKRKNGKTYKAKSSSSVASLIKHVTMNGHVLVTTYSAVRLHSEVILPVKWAYAVLDEGHKIRNPDAEVTLACKQLKTPHRIILSGTPIQNNLSELWSLYDFVFRTYD